MSKTNLTSSEELEESQELKGLRRQRSTLRAQATRKLNELETLFVAREFDVDLLKVKIEFLTKIQNDLVLLDSRLHNFLSDDDFDADSQECLDRQENIEVCVAKAKRIITNINTELDEYRIEAPNELDAPDNLDPNKEKLDHEDVTPLEPDELVKLRRQRNIQYRFSTSLISQLEPLLKVKEPDIIHVKVQLQQLVSTRDKIMTFNAQILDYIEDDEANLLEVMTISERENLMNRKILEAENLIQIFNADKESICSHYSNGKSVCSHHTQGTLHDNSSGESYRLPKLDLPRFDGNILEFKNFFRNFKASVHSNKKMSTITKLQILLSLLDGDAKQSVIGYDLEDQSYDDIIAGLIEEYDHVPKVVELHIMKLVNLDSPRYVHADIKKFKSDIECHIRSLKTLKILNEDDGGSVIFSTILAQKLPTEMLDRVNWEKLKQNWTMGLVMTALSNALLILAAKEIKVTTPRPVAFKQVTIPAKCNNRSNKTSPQTSRTNNALTVQTAQAKATGPQVANVETQRPAGNGQSNLRQSNFRSQIPPLCLLCRGDHWVNSCTTYPTGQERNRKARELNLCLNCLSNRHSIIHCPSNYVCRNCTGKHHSSLCFKARSTHTTDGAPPNVSSGPNSSVNCSTAPSKNEVHTTKTTTVWSSSSNSGVALPTAMLTVEAFGGFIKTRAVFDQCSQATLILKSLVDYLRLPRVGSICMALSGINTISERHEHDIVCLNVHTMSGIVPLKAIVVSSLPNTVHTPGLEVVAAKLRGLHLNLADPYVGDKVDHIAVLVGADQYALFCDRQAEQIDGVDLINTSLGKMIWGQLPPSVTDFSPVSNITTILRLGCHRNDDLVKSVLNVTTDEQLNEAQTIQRDLDIIWNLDSIGISTKEMSSAEKQAVVDFEKYLEYKDGKYIARLLWKPNHPPLPDNYGLAKACLYSTIRRLSKTPELLDSYHQVFVDQYLRNLLHKILSNITPSVHINLQEIRHKN